MKPHPLKVERELRGWSQARVAEAVGTNVRTVIRWEQRQAVPYPYYRELLCELFSKNARDLGLLEPTEASRPTELPAPSRSPDVPLLDPSMPTATNVDWLIGREALLAQVKTRLSIKGARALAALYGLPGMGKTTLAVALATDEQFRERFEGVLWAGLGPEPDVVSHLARWGALLGVSPSNVEQVQQPASWTRALRTAIGQRRLLLVIDDAWQPEDALALQVGGSQCAHLLTTRLPQLAFGFAREQTFNLLELPEHESLTLLARFVPPVVQQDPEISRELVRATGGSPLALTLMGHYLAAQAFTGQDRRLQAALAQVRDATRRLQVSMPVSADPRFPSLPEGLPLSLQAVIAVSERRISEQAREALRILALFPAKPNSFSEEAALAVSAASQETLDELWDAGLLESQGSGRYTLHQTIADYAHAQPTDTLAQRRLVAYIRWYIQEYKHNYETLELEQSTIMMALEAAFEQHMLPELVTSVHTFATALLPRGRSVLVETHLQRSLEAARELGDTLGQITALFHLGKIAEQRGNYIQAQDYWQQGLSLAQECEHHHERARMLRERGTLAWLQGRMQQAHSWLSEALELQRDLGDQQGVAETLRNLGNLAADQGQSGQARSLYQEALEIFRSLHDQRGIAITLQNLGILAREQGQPEQARQLYEDALAILRHLKDSRIGHVLSNLGNLTRHQGQPEQARQFLDEALAILRQTGNQRGLSFTLLNLGCLATDQGQFEQARQFLDEALAIARDLGKRHLAITLLAVGTLAWKQEQFEQACQLLDETLALFRDLKDQRQEALTLREQGNLARQQEQPEQAQRLYTTALAILLQLNDQREVSVTRQELGKLTRLQGDLEGALSLFKEALATSRQIKDRQSTAQTLKELGFLHQQQEAWELALQTLIKAGVGLTLINSPDVSLVKESIKQTRDHMDETMFLTTVNTVLQDAPESAYGLDQAQWRATIQMLVLSQEW